MKKQRTFLLISGKVKKRQKRYTFLTILVALTTLGLNANLALAVTLSSASVQPSDPRPNAASVTYTFSGSSVSLSAIKCIQMVFSTSASGGSNPSSMITSGAALDNTNTNYVPTPSSWAAASPTAGTVNITNAGGETPASSSARKVVVSGITNSATADTNLFLRFNTFNNTDCVSSPVDGVTVAFILTNGQTLSLSVDPTLSFTVNTVGASQPCNGATTTQASTSTTIPFGSVTAASNAIVCQDLLVATNAGQGYSVYIRYTGKPQSGPNQIADHSGSNAAPTAFSAAGTEAYGYTTEDATLQSLAVNRFISDKWAANTTTNAEVAYDGSAVTSQTTRVGHQVGIAGTTKPGIYSTTVIYTCTPIY